MQTVNMVFNANIKTYHMSLARLAYIDPISWAGLQKRFKLKRFNKQIFPQAENGRKRELVKNSPCNDTDKYNLGITRPAQHALRGLILASWCPAIDIFH